MLFFAPLSQEECLCFLMENSIAPGGCSIHTFDQIFINQRLLKVKSDGGLWGATLFIKTNTDYCMDVAPNLTVGVLDALNWQ